MKHTTLILIVALTTLTGCASFRESYKEQAWTPDGFNYTHAVDHKGFKPSQHYFGLSWSLK